MADITVTASRTTLEAPVSVQPRPGISVGVEVPGRPELNLDVAVTRPQVSVAVVPNSGGPSGATSFTHTQDTPASIWSIPNPFGSAEVADVTFKDSSGRVMGVDWDTSSPLYVVLSFPSPRTGKAFLRKA